MTSLLSLSLATSIALTAAPPGSAATGVDPSARDAKTSRIIAGAPLGNEDVQVHVVEPRAHLNRGHHELTIYPIAMQLDSAFTRHVGVAIGYGHHVFERLSVQVLPFFNYLSEESGFQAELIDKGSLQAEAASALLMRFGATAGVEIVPIDGKFAFGEHLLGHFSLVLNAGIGVAASRVQLSQDGFGDTGARFLGSIGLGVRLALGERFALRLEVRDLITTARVGKINGCTHGDLTALQAGATAGEACDADAFASDVELNNARSLLAQISSEVINHLSLLIGASVLF